MTKKRQQTRLAGATISEFDGVRYLHLGTEWVQGAMRMAKPRKLELEYIQRMMVWLLWLPTEALAEFKPGGPGRALQLGLGAAAITRFTHQVLRWHTTAVEINPSVVTACRIWFHLPADDERLRVEDAGRDRFERGGDLLLLGRDRARGFDREQEADLVGERAKRRGLRGLIAQVGDDVRGERMREDMQGHWGWGLDDGVWAIGVTTSRVLLFLRGVVRIPCGGLFLCRAVPAKLKASGRLLRGGVWASPAPS